ncbi:hypothetical protein [Bosea sp. (in: a-proteobacteria)]|nr:hypothetical protein [Bosea sp. (in: a-proteobacteria)]MCO5092629.1 hypothetical protein [Bosea sp. (in: a-proteobacteria)]
MTAETIIGISIAITIAAWLIRFAIWIAWPRKAHDPYEQAHGWEEGQ